jgi:hypothetical protein
VNPEDIGKLLLDAVPPLAAPPDRMAQVRRRVVRANLLRTSASALAIATVVGGGGVLGVQTLAAVGPPGSGGGQPGIAASPGDCSPGSDRPIPQSTWASKRPTIGSVFYSVTLCRYRYQGGRQYLVAGPVQADPYVILNLIRHFTPSGPALLPPAMSTTPEPAGSPDRPAGSAAGSVTPAPLSPPPSPWDPSGSPWDPSASPWAPSGSPGWQSPGIVTLSPWPSGVPTNGCRAGMASVGTVDEIYIVDPNGNSFGYILARSGCPGYSPGPADAALYAAIDRLLGPPD